VPVHLQLLLSPLVSISSRAKTTPSWEPLRQLFGKEEVQQFAKGPPLLLDMWGPAWSSGQHPWENTLPQTGWQSGRVKLHSRALGPGWVPLPLPRGVPLVATWHQGASWHQRGSFVPMRQDSGIWLGAGCSTLLGKLKGSPLPCPQPPTCWNRQHQPG
jgi:hypothetical protein